MKNCQIFILKFNNNLKKLFFYINFIFDVFYISFIFNRYI